MPTTRLRRRRALRPAGHLDAMDLPWMVVSYEAVAPGGTCLEEQDDLAAYAGAFDQLRAYALSPAQSALLLRGLVGD